LHFTILSGNSNGIKKKKKKKNIGTDLFQQGKVKKFMKLITVGDET